MLLTWSFVELFLHSVKSIVHNRKSLPFLAKSGHGLGCVGPFGLAVEGFAGGAVEIDAEELVRQAQ